MAEVYAVTIKRSDKDHGGLYRPNASCPPARQTSSRLIGCPFELYATFSKETNNWTVSVRNVSHNHEASLHASGHSSNRRLNTEQKTVVSQLTAAMRVHHGSIFGKQ
ncbi:hypothetical protein PsorP6_011747 [Peronosclerospora sorghi]|uniref:Uncharacterized protein n=1 Tax=Peronosclerospora sorghi TaxID=230839 RepID=A0ACC0WI88_9STRA|nr:hypothetical protein PsorP6_011747 [Peronosclerospora sorghi]